MNHEPAPKKTRANATLGHDPSLERREALLRELAAVIGTEWADAVCAEERRRRGSIQGGWPRTLPEARSRVAHVVGERLSVLRWPPLTAEESAIAVAAAYDRARRVWQHAAKQVGRADPELDG